MNSTKADGAITRLIWAGAIALLAAACGAEAPPASEPAETDEGRLPEVWQNVLAETKRFAELPPSDDVEQWYKRLDEAIARLAADMGRDGIERMIRTSERFWAAYRKDTELYGRVPRFSILVIAEVADPNDTHRVASRVRRRRVSPPYQHFGVGWDGAALAAIDCYHDEAARDLLLEMALKDEGGTLCWYDGQSFWLKAAPPLPLGIPQWSHGAVYALGFLRGYEPGKVRPQIEKALHEQEALSKREQPDDPAAKEKRAQAAARAAYLRSLTASWDYAAGLDTPVDRDRYRDFERRLWLSWALSREGFRRIEGRYGDAAHLFDETWREGDEHFLLRIFESPTSTVEELLIATRLVRRLSDEGLKRLKAAAEGDSARAKIAQRAVGLAERWKERERRLRSAVRGSPPTPPE